MVALCGDMCCSGESFFRPKPSNGLTFCSRLCSGASRRAFILLTRLQTVTLGVEAAKDNKMVARHGLKKTNIFHRPQKESNQVLLLSSFLPDPDF